MTTPQTNPELPILPKSLLNTIGEYGMARTDRVTPIEITHRWEMLIAGIKDYAASVRDAATQTAKAAPEGVSAPKALCAVCGGGRHVAAHRPILSGPNEGEPLDHVFTVETAPPIPHRFQHTFCQACGKDCGPGDDGPIDCSGHVPDVTKMVPLAPTPGFVLVPTRPTKEMIDAGMEGLGPCVGSCGEASPPERTDFRDCYVAMLAAAPQPPASVQPLAVGVETRLSDSHLERLIGEDSGFEWTGDFYRADPADLLEFLRLVSRTSFSAASPPPPGRVEPLTDQEMMHKLINACDSLHITRVHELGGITRTIMEDPGLLELGRAIEAAHGIKEGS